MVSIITKYGEFARWHSVLAFMLEEGLASINVTRVEYVFDEVYGKGIYSLREVQEIVRGIDANVGFEDIMEEFNYV